MGDQAAIAERGGVAIDDEHAFLEPDLRDHLSGTAVGVHIACERHPLAMPSTDGAGANSDRSRFAA